MHETSGVLADAIHAYLEHDAITPARLLAIRAYFVQWVDKGEWAIEDGQRKNFIDWARTLRNRLDIDLWLAAAEALGMDPL
jgi:hypothetical protein